MTVEGTWRKIILQLAQTCWEQENKLTGLIALLSAKGISFSDSELSQAAHDADLARRDALRRAGQSQIESAIEDLMNFEGTKQ